MKFLLLTVLIISSGFCGACFIHGPSAERPETVCYKDIGCFSNAEPFFNIILRPKNVAPAKPNLINTTFLLFTRRNPIFEEYLSNDDMDVIRSSFFDSERKTVFLIHGFTDQASSPWIRNLKDALLNVSNINVIIVDWSAGANFPYVQAVANARVVGRIIGNLLISMKKNFDVNLNTTHIIGHSLGAQVAGYVGQWLNGTLRRITGLDPAGPYFQCLPPEVSLDASDAMFVDVIHTSGRHKPFASLGLIEPIGHADIFPNGGRQDNFCLPENEIRISLIGIIDEVRNVLVCNHFKAVNIYAASIQGSCPFTSYACQNYTSYLNGQCSTCTRPGIDCTYAGYHIDDFNNTGLNRTRFYLTAGDLMASLCIYHWILEFDVIQSEIMNDSFNFLISIKGLNNVNLNKTLPFRSNTSNLSDDHRFLLEFPEDPIFVHTLAISWEFNDPELNEVENRNETSSLFINNITIFPIDIIQSEKQMEKTSLFCDKSLRNGMTWKRVYTLKSKTDCSSIQKN